MENLMNVVIESFEKLEMEDKEYVFGLLKKHIIEMRRDKIHKRAGEAFDNYVKGNVQKGSIRELFKDLEG
jgi:hypothetical protein